MKQLTSLPVKCLLTLIFGVSFGCFAITLPNHGWIPPHEIYGFFIDNRFTFAALILISLTLIIFISEFDRRRQKRQKELELFFCVFIYSLFFEALLHIPFKPLDWLWRIIHFPSHVLTSLFSVKLPYSDFILIGGWFGDLYLFSFLVTLLILRNHGSKSQEPSG
jgi:hypothetical protein